MRTKKTEKEDESVIKKMNIMSTTHFNRTTTRQKPVNSKRILVHMSSINKRIREREREIH